MSDEQQTKSVWFRVTPFSKYTAMVLFIAMPFVGGWIGYSLAPLEVVEAPTVASSTTSLSTKEHIPNNTEAEKERVATTESRGSVMIKDTGDYSIWLSDGEVSIKHKDQFVQTIPTVSSSDLSFNFTSATSGDLFITGYDINYDDHPDVGILMSIGHAGRHRFFQFYVYDPVTQRLRKEDSLDLGESGISNPQISMLYKTITSSIFNSAEERWDYTEYHFNGSMYEKGREYSEEWANLETRR